jgi:hypothetical protein
MLKYSSEDDIFNEMSEKQYFVYKRHIVQISVRIW